MLPNIDRAVYGIFKTDLQKSGYRKAIYRSTPVESVADIVQLGYLDVHRTLTGIGNDPAQSTSFKKCAVAFIDGLLRKPPADQSEFDIRHYECCLRCTECGGVARIHYGQGQKLVNMSLKYLYNEFAFYLGKMNYFGFPNTNIEYFFHLPIDNQILTSLVRNCGFSRPTPLPWSKWGHEHYTRFQHELRSRLINSHKPLEIDYMLWNEARQSIDDAIRPA